MDNDTTAFPRTAAVQPGTSGSSVLEGAGRLLGVTVARVNEVAALAATASAPQSVGFGMEGDVAANPGQARERARIHASRICVQVIAEEGCDALTGGAWGRVLHGHRVGMGSI